MELPALGALAKEVQWELQKVKEFEDIVFFGASSLRATNDRRQHWHRDRPLTHKTQGRALSIFVPCNVDTPGDASCGRYVPFSHKGVPKPLYEYPLNMDVGDMVIFTSELILCGGAFRWGYLQALLGSLPSLRWLITICTTTTPCRFPTHHGRMPKRRYKH